jgi:hypothetical protein
MSTERNLFDPMCGRSVSRPRELFPAGWDELSDRFCEECGEPLALTPSGYLACLRGHGKLLSEQAEDEEGSGAWFDDTEQETTP